MTKEKAKPGPTPEFIEWFCEEYSSTPETHAQVLARTPPELGPAPTVSTLGVWLRKYDAFSKQYAAVKKFKGSICFDEAQHEADACRLGEIVTTGTRTPRPTKNNPAPEPIEETNTKTIDNVERSKLRVQVLIQRGKSVDPELRDQANVQVNVNDGLADKIAKARKRSA